ncbi:MAG: PTS glucitol/sorbitol transporter subunit IIA, partial [Tetragenococcus koreensis]|nr:PTS glucitol/sorbitol transporter subunit IIA [Tetragenococcus koreensis]
ISSVSELMWYNFNYKKDTRRKEYMQQGKILKVGDQAVDKNENLLIFFGESVTKGLKPYSIVQDIDEPEKIELTVGDKILFGQQEYQVTYVGRLVNQNLQTIQHTSFVFSDEPQDKLTSSVYLTPAKIPDISEGMTITYC